MSAEVSTYDHKWVGASNYLKTLENELVNHIKNCDGSNINGLIPVCCADLVISVQKAKDVVDKEWNELYRISSLSRTPI